MSVLIELLVLLGCSHPTEKTFQMLTALHALITIGQAAILDLPSLEKARMLRFMKDSFRRRAKFAGPQTVHVESLPPQASTFLETYPSYEYVFEGELPSALPYDENLLRWLADSFPMRSTKVVSFGNPSAPSSSLAQMHVNPFAGGSQQPMQLCLQDACMKALSAFMRPPQEKGPDDIGLNILPPHLQSRFRSGPLEVAPLAVAPLAVAPLAVAPMEVAPLAVAPLASALVETPATALRKRKKCRKKKKQLESALVPKSSASAIEASDEIFRGILARTKGKAEEKKKKKIVHEVKKAVLKPAKAVAKRPAAHVLVAGCSKCRYLLNGCGKCRPIGWKKR